MRKFLLVSDKGELLPIAQRLQEEGASVKLLSTHPSAKKAGEGLVPLATPENLLETDMKRGYLILNQSVQETFSEYANLGWRVLGDDAAFLPRDAFQMTKQLALWRQPIPPTHYVPRLSDIALNGTGRKVSSGHIGQEVSVAGDDGAAWLRWQSRKADGTFMVQDFPEGAEVEFAFWVIQGKLLSPLLAAVVKNGQALAWAETGEGCIKALSSLAPHFKDYTGPVWTTVYMGEKPRDVYLRTVSGQWPSYMWGGFLALLNGDLGDFLENLFHEGTLELSEGWAWMMPATINSLPFTSVADILKDCPIEGEAHLWDAYKDGEIKTGGLSESPVTLWGKGDSPGAAQEDAQGRWMKLTCPFKTPAPPVLEEFRKTLKTLNRYGLCTKEA